MTLYKDLKQQSDANDGQLLGIAVLSLNNASEKKMLRLPLSNDITTQMSGIC